MTTEFEIEMMVLASAVVKAIMLSRRAGLSQDAAALGAMIGALSVIRIDGLNEDAILKEARRACPQHLSKLATA